MLHSKYLFIVINNIKSINQKKLKSIIKVRQICGQNPQVEYAADLQAGRGLLPVGHLVLVQLQEVGEQLP